MLNPVATTTFRSPDATAEDGLLSRALRRSSSSASRSALLRMASISRMARGAAGMAYQCESLGVNTETSPQFSLAGTSPMHF